MCDICGYVGRDKFNLRKHYYTHTGEKPYGCPLCPYKATQSSNLFAHHKRVHPNAEPLITMNKQMQSQNVPVFERSLGVGSFESSFSMLNEGTEKPHSPDHDWSP